MILPKYFPRRRLRRRHCLGRGRGGLLWHLETLNWRGTMPEQGSRINVLELCLYQKRTGQHARGIRMRERGCYRGCEGERERCRGWS